MALAFAKVFDAASVSGTIRETFYDVTFDSSYPTGGEAISPKDLGLSQIYGLDVLGSSLVAGTAPTSRYRFEWDYKNGKLQAFASATPAGTIAVTDGAVTVVGGGIGEAIGINPDSNAGALSKAAATTRTIPQATFGIAATTATFTGTAGTSSPASEAANGTNLSTYVLRIRAVGN
jgi:hypothetical protein